MSKLRTYRGQQICLVRGTAGDTVGSMLPHTTLAVSFQSNYQQENVT